MLVEAGLRGVPSAVSCHAVMALPDRLPGPEYLGEIAPRNPAPIAVDDALDYCSGVSERAALLAGGTWEEISDQCPLGI